MIYKGSIGGAICLMEGYRSYIIGQYDIYSRYIGSIGGL